MGELVLGSESNTKCRVKPMVLQVEYHPLLMQPDLLEFCDEHNILLQAYASLGGSEGASKDKKEANLMENEVVKTLAEKHSVSPGAVLLRWALQKGFGIIPKSSKETRIASNVDEKGILALRLSEEDMAKLDGMNGDNPPKRLTWKGADPDGEA